MNELQTENKTVVIKSSMYTCRVLGSFQKVPNLILFGNFVEKFYIGISKQGWIYKKNFF